MASGPSAGNGTLVTPLSPPVKDDQRCATPQTTKPRAMRDEDEVHAARAHREPEHQREQRSRRRRPPARRAPWARRSAPAGSRRCTPRRRRTTRGRARRGPRGRAGDRSRARAGRRSASAWRGPVQNGPATKRQDEHRRASATSAIAGSNGSNSTLPAEEPARPDEQQERHRPEQHEVGELRQQPAPVGVEQADDRARRSSRPRGCRGRRRSRPPARRPGSPTPRRDRA